MSLTRAGDPLFFLLCNFYYHALPAIFVFLLYCADDAAAGDVSDDVPNDEQLWVYGAFSVSVLENNNTTCQHQLDLQLPY